MKIKRKSPTILIVLESFKIESISKTNQEISLIIEKIVLLDSTKNIQLIRDAGVHLETGEVTCGIILTYSTTIVKTNLNLPTVQNDKQQMQRWC